MKTKKFAALLALLLVFPFVSQAQSYEHKCEISLAVGGVPKTHFMEDMKTVIDPSALYKTNPDLLNLYGDAVHTYISPAWCTPSFSFEAGYSIKRWLKVSLEANYDHVVGNVLNESDGKALWSLSIEEIAIIPRVRFYFAFSKYTCCYGGFGIGPVFRWGNGITPDNSIKKIAPVFEIVPIGFSVGRKVCGFIEISLGNYMLGGRTGIGYRF